MIVAVFDTNVVYSALYFGGKPLLCLETVALSLCRPAVTNEILEEYEDILPEAPKGSRLHPDISKWLAWFKLAALKVEPGKLGDISSRDVKDNPFLACAISARAHFLISGDEDLLSFENPFTFQILKPADFLSHFAPQNLS